MSGKDVDVQEVAKTLQDALGSIIKNAKSEDIEQPFKTETGQQYEKLVSRPKSEVDSKKPLVGLKTGTFLDKMFLNRDGKLLGGIPIVGQYGLTGLSGCGKSILVHEIALSVASEGKKVVFVTSEEPFEVSNLRNDLQSRMKEKADIMGLNWEDIRNNLFVLDAVTSSALRNWGDFIQTIRYITELLNGIDLLILDSLTLLETSPYNLKWRVLSLSRYCQLKGITTLYVCQRSGDKGDELSVSGGINISHNLDGMICVDKVKASGRIKAELNKKQWEETHFTRILASRLGEFDPQYKEIYITNNGFLKLVKFDQKT